MLAVVVVVDVVEVVVMVVVVEVVVMVVLLRCCSFSRDEERGGGCPISVLSCCRGCGHALLSYLGADSLALLHAIRPRHHCDHPSYSNHPTLHQALA